MGFKPIHIFLIPPFKSCKLLNCSTLFQRGKKVQLYSKLEFFWTNPDPTFHTVPIPIRLKSAKSGIPSVLARFGSATLNMKNVNKRKQNSLKTYLQNKLKIIYDRINNMTCHATPFLLEHLQRTVITNIINMIYWLCTNLQS